jgi:hypothetical protein
MVKAAAVPYRVLYITIPSPPSPTPDVALIVRSKIPGRELRYVFVLDLFYKSQYAVGLYQPVFFVATLHSEWFYCRQQKACQLAAGRTGLVLSGPQQQLLQYLQLLLTPERCKLLCNIFQTAVIDTRNTIVK